MYDTEDYFSLEPDVMSLATSMWAGEVLYLSNAPSINQIPDYLAKVGDNRNVESRKRSKYWYKKMDGQRLRTQAEIAKIDRILPGTGRILCHPVWSLLESKQLTSNRLLQIASKLPFNLQRQILNNCQTAIRPPRSLNKILTNTNLDGLCALLLLYLERKNERNAAIYFSMGASLILRFFCKKSKTHQHGWMLYLYFLNAFQGFESIFKKLVGRDEDGQIIKEVNLSLPLFFNIISSAEMFTAYCDRYESILDSIIEKIPYFETVEKATRLKAFVPHNGLLELEFDIMQYPHLLKGSRLSDALYFYKKVFRSSF